MLDNIAYLQDLAIRQECVADLLEEWEDDDFQKEIALKMRKRSYFVRAAEKARRCPPSSYEIAETKRLLRDFGVYDEVPRFNTRIDLELWRKGKIEDALS